MCSFAGSTRTAGAILGLLKLHTLAPIDSLLQRVRECSEHLIVNQLKQNGGVAAWPGRAVNPATGFAHGAAGIAYALFQAHVYLPEHAFLAAAFSAVEYESSLYLRKERNWLDVQSIGRPEWQKCAKSWCHGSVGIGLSRAGMLKLLKNRHLRRDLATALCSVLEENGPSLDQLCCGKMGTIDLLVTAGCYLQREDLLAKARKRGAGILERARAAGGYRLLSIEPDVTGSPGLFTGLAGIGYEFLRLANPQLPSVLLLE